MAAEERAELALTPLRLCLRANGYSPVPAHQKRVLLRGWTAKRDAGADEVAGWERDHPDWTNTGILTETVPTIDFDIQHPEAADYAESLVSDMFGERGILIKRFGAPPKRCIFFRTDEPFAKVCRVLIHPNCRDASGKEIKQRIEVLGQGQQVIVAGLHPDTKLPYSYHGDRTPLTVPRTELPPITRDEAQAFVDLAAEALILEFGFREPAPDDDTVVQWPDGKPVDAGVELTAITSGAKANEIQPRVICQKLRECCDPNEIVEFVVNATMAMATKHDLTQSDGTTPWSRAAEVAMVRRRVLSAINNVFLKDYDHTHGEIPIWLDPKYHERWLEIVKAGRRPCCCFNNGGFFIRALRYDHHTLNGGADPNDADGNPTHSDPEPDRAGSHDEKHTAQRGVIQATPFAPFDPAALRKRQWLYGKYYLLGTASATIGPGGGGKSSLSLVEIIALAAGRDLLGEAPVRRCRGWYHNGEDDMDELKRRIAAVCQHYTIPQTDLVGWLHVTSGVEMPIKIATVTNGRGGTHGIIDKTTTAAIIKEIDLYEIDVAVFDPLIAHHIGGEGAPGDMDQIAREFIRIAYVTNSSVSVVHHTRKPAPGQEEHTIYDSRGPGALIDAVRASRVLNVMSSTEAAKARIDDVERRLHFRIDSGKGNRAVPEAAKWFRLVNVPLPNGDDVGVVTSWQYASSVEDLPDSVCVQIQNEVLAAQGQFRAAKQSPNWIGNLIARVFRIDRNEKQGSARIGAILRILYTKGVIAATSADPKKHGVEIITIGSWVPGK